MQSIYSGTTRGMLSGEDIRQRRLAQVLPLINMRREDEARAQASLESERARMAELKRQQVAQHMQGLANQQAKQEAMAEQKRREELAMSERLRQESLADAVRKEGQTTDQDRWQKDYDARQAAEERRYQLDKLQGEMSKAPRTLSPLEEEELKARIDREKRETAILGQPKAPTESELALAEQRRFEKKRQQADVKSTIEEARKNMTGAKERLDKTPPPSGWFDKGGDAYRRATKEFSDAKDKYDALNEAFSGLLDPTSLSEQAPAPAPAPAPAEQVSTTVKAETRTKPYNGRGFMRQGDKMVGLVGGKVEEGFEAYGRGVESLGGEMNLFDRTRTINATAPGAPDPRSIAGPSLSAEAPNKTAFSTVAEAEASGLPKGTRITIGGRPAVVE